MRRHVDFSREIGEGMAGEAVSRAGFWVDINALFLDRLVGAEGNLMAPEVDIVSLSTKLLEGTLAKLGGLYRRRLLLGGQRNFLCYLR